MDRISTFAVVLTAITFAGNTFAQNASQPASRSEIKAETRALEKAGKLVPAGEGSPKDELKGTSDKTRAQRKAETRAARKAGELAPAGDAEELQQEKSELSAKSTKTRAQRKAEERADAKAGRLVPAGEGPTAPTK
jgi:hypothetical protein